MNILITGGAGYIGSHVVKQLLEYTHYHLYVLDNLSTGHQETINTLQKIRNFAFIELDLNQFKDVEEVIVQNKINIIFHFAGSIDVAESIKNPKKYFDNNTKNTENLIQYAIQHNVEKFIFSSTAAVYGNIENIDLNGISETAFTNPINPYGESKLLSEKFLRNSIDKSKKLKYVIFRYFNVAGSDINYLNDILTPRIGELHQPETHLIPLVAKTALKKQSSIKIFGTDYDTPDGTCIRDYIHVEDLANAHIKAIQYLDNHESDIFNVGYGKGFSVKEVINTMKKVTNSNIQIYFENRREGDPAILISNNNKIISKMNWKPRYNDLALICSSTYQWEKTIKKGSRKTLEP